MSQPAGLDDQDPDPDLITPSNVNLIVPVKLYVR
jgi:hypothetical protein